MPAQASGKHYGCCNRNPLPLSKEDIDDASNRCYCHGADESSKFLNLSSSQCLEAPHGDGLVCINARITVNTRVEYFSR